MTARKAQGVTPYAPIWPPPSSSFPARASTGKQAMAAICGRGEVAIRASRQLIPVPWMASINASLISTGIERPERVAAGLQGRSAPIVETGRRARRPHPGQDEILGTARHRPSSKASRKTESSLTSETVNHSISVEMTFPNGR